MSKIGKISNHDGDYVFYCLGCKSLHQFSDKTSQSEGAKWTFDLNMENPTLSPSYLLWHDHPTTKKRYTCHSFIRDGKIQYLSDCSHDYKGQTVELPAWDITYNSKDDE